MRSLIILEGINPTKFSSDYDNYKEDQYIKEMENEYYLSTSDEEDGLFVSENNIY